MKCNIPQNAVLSSASKDVFTDSLTQSVHWLWPIIILKATIESWLREDLKDYHILTPWRLGGFGDFHKKNSSFQLPYQRPSSSADCAWELFNGSNGSASLVDCTRKIISCLGVRVFCEWCHKWRTFRPPWPTLPGPGRQPLGGSISLKFLLETRLQSESFDPLDDLLGFRVQKLWCKLVKIFD